MKGPVLALFTIDGDRLTHQWLTPEWHRMAAKKATRQAAGSLGGQTTAHRRGMDNFNQKRVQHPGQHPCQHVVLTAAKSLTDIDRPPSKRGSDTDTEKKKEKKEDAKPSPSPLNEASASRKNGIQEKELVSMTEKLNDRPASVEVARLLQECGKCFDEWSQIPT